jgi:hypothetical protein
VAVSRAEVVEMDTNNGYSRPKTRRQAPQRFLWNRYSCHVDAKEKRGMVKCNIPGAFMQAGIDKVLHVRLEGPLYVRLAKALYGTLQAALLFWKDLTGYLQELGFTLNPYDNCVANKTIDGTQCSVLWHVDDLQILHVNQAVLEDLVGMLNKQYGKLDPLIVTRGDIHDYLGMTLDYSTPGRVTIRMGNYVRDLLEEAPEDMGGTAATPAADHLFTVSENPTYLDDAESELFHHTTAKLLFL